MPPVPAKRSASAAAPSHAITKDQVGHFPKWTDKRQGCKLASCHKLSSVAVKRGEATTSWRSRGGDNGGRRGSGGHQATTSWRGRGGGNGGRRGGGGHQATTSWRRGGGNGGRRGGGRHATQWRRGGGR